MLYSRCKGFFTRNCLLTTLRGFSRSKKHKRIRLTEYNRYDAPIRLREWRERIEDGRGFIPYQLHEMTPQEVVETVVLAGKMTLPNPVFWERATLALGDSIPTFGAKQITAVCHALGRASWHDPELASMMAPAIARVATTFRPGDLAVVVQSFARTRIHHKFALSVLTRAVLVNTRLDHNGYTIIAESFATLRFHSESFTEKLDEWASNGGVRKCNAEQLGVLLRSLTTLTPQKESIGKNLLSELSSLAANLASRLPPPTLVLTLAGLAKLNACDKTLLVTFEEALQQHLHMMPLSALPVVLEAFALMYKACGFVGGDPSFITKRRKALLAQITGRLTRELRLLRPQDACRSLQALDMIGLIAPYLTTAVGSILHNQLTTWLPKDLLALLQAYAAAENYDVFMVTHLRRALMPIIPHTTRDGFSFDPAPLAQLDDMAVVHVAQAFASLSCTDGIVSLLATVWPTCSEPRELIRSCAFALGATVELAIPSVEDWRCAIKSFKTAEAIAYQQDVYFGTEMYLSACSQGNVETTEVDAILLALCVFPGDGCRLKWANKLRQNIEDCSTVLLPGLLLADIDLISETGLKDAVEEELIQRLISGNVDLPAGVAIACIRALATCIEGSSMQSLLALKEATTMLLPVIIAHSEAGKIDAKGVVRTLQTLQGLQMESPAALTRCFALTSSALSPADFVASLRFLTARSILESRQNDVLGAMASRVMTRLRSSRQAWELQFLCKKLALDMDIDEE